MKVTDKTFNLANSYDSGWTDNQMYLGVDCGNGNIVYAEMRGGYFPEDDNILRGFSKDDRDDSGKSKMVEIAWEDRFDEDLLDTIADSSFITVGVDNVSVKTEITSIALSKVEDEKDFKATFSQMILLDSDSIGKKDPEKNTIGLNAYVVDYVGKPKINGKKVDIRKNISYPKFFEVQVHDDPEVTDRMLNRYFKVKKKDKVNVLTVTGNLVEGAAIVNITEDDIPDDIKELIAMGLYSEEEAKAKCAVGGNNRERRMVIVKPDITYVGQDDDRKPTVAFEENVYDRNDLYFYEQALNEAGVDLEDNTESDNNSSTEETSEDDDLLAMLESM